MTKRLILSLVMITLALVGVTGATYAYFSSGKVLGSNTFATGTVKIGGFNTQGVSVTGLTPGVPVWATNIGVNYTGSVNADLYIGAGGTSGPENIAYIADVTYLRIYIHGMGTIVWEGYVNALSTHWASLASNIGAGWQAYDLQFTLNSDVGNDKQGVNNVDTQILVYAVQTGGPVPVTMPYLTTSFPF